MTKPSPSCWLYLNCEDMTGHPADQCPNGAACEDNAKASEHRVCELPYFCWEADPRFDELFDHPGYKALSVLYCYDDEAIAAGWHHGRELFWVYRDNVLWIGRDPRRAIYSLDIPPEAQALGFARSEDFPYLYEAGLLRVIPHFKGYPQHFLEAGWFPAMDLPYYYQHDGMRVAFPFRHPEYKDAIAAGWHPAEFLPEYDPYYCDEDDDEDEW